MLGLVEAVAPVLGRAAGVAASSLIEAVDHWIASMRLLAAVGLHMLFSAPARKERDAAPVGRSMTVLVATAIGTSLDAMGVGMSLAFLDVNIAVIALVIGLATFLMSSGGMLVGRLIGERLGRAAEAVAGVALVGLGASILVDHVFA